MVELVDGRMIRWLIDWVGGWVHYKLGGLVVGLVDDSHLVDEWFGGWMDRRMDG